MPQPRHSVDAASYVPPAEQLLEIVRPETEESFCNNFVCCGSFLPDLHALLQHYEDVHVPAAIAASGVASSLQQQAQAPSHLAALTADKDNLRLLCSILSNSLDAGPAPPMPPAPPRMPSPAPANTATAPSQSGSGGSGAKRISFSSIMIANRPAIIDRSSSHPYKCPVPSCRRSYKNPNGLKYHAAHAHLNLSLPPISPPEAHSSATAASQKSPPVSGSGQPPWWAELDFDDDGGAADEEAKPHRCSVPGCAKRYKNANGLKYHMSHAHKKPLVRITVEHHSPPTKANSASFTSSTNSATFTSSTNSAVVPQVVTVQANTAHSPPAIVLVSPAQSYPVVINGSISAAGANNAGNVGNGRRQ